MWRRPARLDGVLVTTPPPSMKTHPSGGRAWGRWTPAKPSSILSHEGQPVLACLCLDASDHDTIEVLKVRPGAGPPWRTSQAKLTWGFVQIPFLMA